ESAGEPHEFAAARKEKHAAVPATSTVAQFPLDDIEDLFRSGPTAPAQHTRVTGEHRIGQRGVDLTGADAADGNVRTRRLLDEDLRVRGDRGLRRGVRGEPWGGQPPRQRTEQYDGSRSRASHAGNDCLTHVHGAEVVDLQYAPQ